MSHRQTEPEHGARNWTSKVMKLLLSTKARKKRFEFSRAVLHRPTPSFLGHQIISFVTTAGSHSPSPSNRSRGVYSTCISIGLGWVDSSVLDDGALAFSLSCFVLGSWQYPLGTGSHRVFLSVQRQPFGRDLVYIVCCSSESTWPRDDILET